ncbi:MAG: DUF2889 domain-containing protein [Gammaproteobacteria bacterium]|nr:DUF2889 domain-containing protein [Gammaproteobacteria bacterium]
MTQQNITRTPIHTRTIVCEGFLRSDQRWDIDARLTDVKHYPFSTIERGILAVGERVHDMTITLTLNDQLTIEAVVVSMQDVPFKICRKVPPRLEQLLGINLTRGWRKEVQKRLALKEGCTHLTELLRVMATTAFQTILPYQNRHTQGAKLIHPNIVNQCQGFRADDEVIQQHFPEYADD